MKDHQLKALVQVAASGSIRAAARDMHLSQSALTKALRELENGVGAELLTRSYKGIAFTPAGEALLTRARLALSILDKAQEEIRLMRGGAGARVAIGVTPLVAARVLPRVLREFERQQPDAELTLTEGLLTSIVPGMIEGDLDFAVAIADPADLPYELEFEPLAQIHAALCGRSGHPLARARRWPELKNARWVLNIAAGSQGSHLLRWMQHQGIPAPQHAIRCASPMLMTELMRRTDHLCVGPALLFEDALFGNGIERIRVEPMPPPMSLGLISLRGVPRASAARRLETLFRRHLRQ